MVSSPFLLQYKAGKTDYASTGPFKHAMGPVCWCYDTATMGVAFVFTCPLLISGNKKTNIKSSCSNDFQIAR